MRGLITEAVAKQRAKEMLRDWFWNSLINAAIAIFVAHDWLNAPWWGAWIIFMFLQQGDARRRANKYGGKS